MCVDMSGPVARYIDSPASQVHNLRQSAYNISEIMLFDRYIESQLSDGRDKDAFMTGKLYYAPLFSWIFSACQILEIVFCVATR